MWERIEEGDWYTSNAVGRKVLTLTPINTFFALAVWLMTNTGEWGSKQRGVSAKGVEFGMELYSGVLCDCQVSSLEYIFGWILTINKRFWSKFSSPFAMNLHDHHRGYKQRERKHQNWKGGSYLFKGQNHFFLRTFFSSVISMNFFSTILFF